MTRHYLDHAASTPMVPAAVEAMTRELTRSGNASALHGSGREARRVVEDARDLIADRLGARPGEVIFTAGATEADNLALKGAFWASPRPQVLVSAIEHPAVLEAAHWLGDQDPEAEVALLPVDATGRVTPDALRLIGERTAIVSVLWAGNEVGALQPVAEVARVARAVGAVSHSDAVQAVGHVGVDFAASGLDLMSVSAHKLGGPVGVGALIARREVALSPVAHGGGQERDVRSGTLDVAAIAGFAAALDVAVTRRTTEAVRLEALRAQLLDVVRAADPTALVYGPTGRFDRLPGSLTVGFPGCPGDAVLLLLDAAGIDVSTGSACSAGVAQPSHVLLAMGATPAEARAVVRFSLGHTSTVADVSAVGAVLPGIVARARAAGAA